MEKKFLTAKWEYLIMANYIIDPLLLLPYLPYKTELDLYNNNCYISLVGFLFNKIKIKGFSIPFHINFEEVNLRFYVQHKNEYEHTRGVVFISEIVPRPAISFVANTFYKEQYRYLPMQHSIQSKPGNITAEYKWKFKNKWSSLSVTADDMLMEIPAASEAEFIAEHYWGYSKANELVTNEYRVEHSRWQMFPIKNYNINCDFAGLYGDQFSFLSQAKPASVFLYKGSAISIGNKHIIK